MKIQLDPGATMPTRAYKKDAGLDIYALNDGVVRAHQSAVFRTGLHIQLPPFTMGDMRSKSGLMFNRDITSDGTIDEGYTGEIKVKLFNHGDEDYNVRAGDKISQLVIVPIYRDPLEQVDELPQDYDRGYAGFGSTGR